MAHSPNAFPLLFVFIRSPMRLPVKQPRRFLYHSRVRCASIVDQCLFCSFQIDAFFDYKLGVLEYRSVRFETETLACPNYQGNAVINYTDADTPYTRIIAHKHFEFGSTEPGTKTVISREYSAEWKPGDEPYYTVNDDKNSALYAKYKALADAEPHVVFGGSLGEYKYSEMDKVIESALACVAVQMDKIIQYKA